MRDSFLFNILGTVAGNWRAVIEFTPILKKKVLSYHLKLKTAKHLVGTSGDDSSALI